MGNRIVYKLCLMILGSLLAVQISWADITDRQRTILQTVMAADGYLDRDLYDQFWGDFPLSFRTNKSQLQQFSNEIDSLYGITANFQRETWLSVKLSLDNERVTQSSGYPEAKAKLQANTLIPEKSRKNSVREAEALMDAAANKKPFNAPQGTIFLTPELVLQVLGGFEASQSRARRLTAPKWSEQLISRTYSDVGVSILSPDPFTWEFQIIEAENGVTGNLTLLMNILGLSEFVSVASIEYDQNLEMHQQRLFAIARGSLNGIGADSTQLIGSKWRGRKSVDMTGKTRLSGGVVYFSGKVVALSDGKALLFQVLTDTSKADADNLLDNFTYSVQLM